MFDQTGKALKLEVDECIFDMQTSHKLELVQIKTIEDY